MKKQLLMLATCLAILTGCSNSNFGSFSDNKQKKLEPVVSIDTTLPKPINIRTIASRNQIGFEWALIDNPRVIAISIYKGDANGSFSKIATLDDRFTTHFASVGLTPDTTYYYRFATNAAGGVESDGSAPVKVKTLPILDAVSFIAPVDNLPKRAKIVWKPHQNDSVIEYQIQKTDSVGIEWATVATIGPRLMAEYIDTNVQSGQTYQYRIMAKTFDGILSLPSKIVQVKPKDLPLAIVDINATKNMPKKIVVQWRGPNATFAEYQVYRGLQADGKYDVVSRTKDTLFYDSIQEDGAVRYYKVSVVDKDGLESTAQQIATGMTRPKPPAPMFTQANIQENKVQLAWDKPNIKEPLKYRITKKWGTINVKETAIEDINGLFYLDTDVQAGEKYTYFIQSIDKEGLASVLSDGVELAIPKLQQ